MIDYLALSKEHARASPNLAHRTLPRLIVRDHRFLQLTLSLVSPRRSLNPEAGNGSQMHSYQRDEVIAFIVGEEPHCTERRYQPRAAQVKDRGHAVEGEEGDLPRGSSPVTPRELGHPGRIEEIALRSAERRSKKRGREEEEEEE